MTAKAERRPHDFYPTPPEVTEILFKHLRQDHHGNRILEPACGDGDIMRVIRAHRPKANITGVDIRPVDPTGYDLFYQDDFLKMDLGGYHAVVTNPPFSLALPFVQKSLDAVMHNGVVAMLLRLSFLESRERFEFNKTHPLWKLIVLHKRPSFTGTGTDRWAYGWFIWRKGKVSKDCELIFE